MKPFHNRRGNTKRIGPYLFDRHGSLLRNSIVGPTNGMEETMAVTQI